MMQNFPSMEKDFNIQVSEPYRKPDNYTKKEAPHGTSQSESQMSNKRQNLNTIQRKAKKRKKSCIKVNALGLEQNFQHEI